MTIIGVITPSGFELINETTYKYTSSAAGPELLLTNVGPVMLDPTQQSMSGAGQGINIINNYINHWVEAVIATRQGNEQLFSGVIIMINDEPYLLHISRDNGPPNYIVGPLTDGNTYIVRDYGIGQYGCEALYSFSWSWFVYEPRVILHAQHRRLAQ